VHVRVLDASGETREGRFEVKFSSEGPLIGQTVTTASDGAETLPAHTFELVQRFASTGFRGGYFSVVTHLPNAHLTLFEPSEGKWGVHCPVDAAGTSTSYVFDDNNVITTRGTVTDKARQIEVMEWENPQGRYFLKAIRVSGFPTETSWQYDDSEFGVGLPQRIVVRRGSSSVEMGFKYRDVVVDRPSRSLPEPPK
jgi:hypothetical protein